MVKKMYCCKCNTYLGEVEKGKYKKDMYFLCSLCKGAMDLMGNTFNTPGNSNKSNPLDMPDIFKDIFK